MNDTLVKVEGVSKKYCKDFKQSLWYGVQDITSEMFGKEVNHDELRKDEFWAVKDISFELKRGECLGLMGPNGAGKSTLLKILNGLIKPDQGKVAMKGRVNALIQLGAGFNPILSGRENIYVNGRVLGFTNKEIDEKFDDIVAFAEMDEFLDMPVQNYSSGMRVRLGFAVAAQLEPDVLILDEVMAVGDIGFRAKCFNAIFEFMENAAVIVVAHMPARISRLSTDILVMDRGKGIYYGKDVSKGIEVYHSFFKSDQSSNNHNIIGSGKAEITKLFFESNGKEVDSVEYLDQLSICVEFLMDSSISEASINIAFTDKKQNIVLQTKSSTNGFKVMNNNNTHKVKSDLGKILLNPGVYSLEIRINKGEWGEILTGLSNACKLHVKGQMTGGAPIQLPSKWENYSTHDINRKTKV